MKIGVSFYDLQNPFAVTAAGQEVLMSVETDERTRGRESSGGLSCLVLTPLHRYPAVKSQESSSPLSGASRN